MNLKGFFSNIVTVLKSVSVKTWIIIATSAVVAITGIIVGVGVLGNNDVPVNEDFQTTPSKEEQKIPNNEEQTTPDNSEENTPSEVVIVGVSLNKSTLTLTVGNTSTLKATIEPSNATDKNVTWMSSNTSVATVNNGVVTAVSTGTATITAKTTNGKTATCVVTVEKSANSYSITYHSNGGTNAPAVQTQNKGTAVRLSSDIPTNEGRNFMGWLCANDGELYNAGESFRASVDVDLYALWGYTCPLCLGNGSSSSTSKCSTCSGTGIFTEVFATQVTCSTCLGGGHSGACSSCKGLGGRVKCSCTCGKVWYLNDGGDRICDGCGRTVNGTRISTCGTCSGSGYANCSRCGGRGYTFQESSQNRTCHSCNGSGTSTSVTSCSTCNGEKTIIEYNIYRITLKNGNSTVTTTSVAINSLYTLTVPKKSGYTFMGWFDEAEGGKQYTNADGTSLSAWLEFSNKTLYAQWKKNCDVVLSKNISSAGSVSGDGTYVEGSSVTVKVTTTTGYTFLGWYENGSKVSSNQNYTFTISKNKTLEAKWRINNYSVCVAKNISVAGSISGDGNYDHGTSVTVTATANEGYTFLGWYENGSLVSSNANYTFTVSVNISFEAKWQINTHTVSVTQNMVEGGTVIGGETYEYGSFVTVNATTNQGYTFLGWYENGSLVSSNANYSFTVSANKSLEARWEINAYTVSTTKNISAAGSVLGDGTYDYGSSVTIKAITNSGYEFIGWYENDVLIASSENYTFTIAGNQTLSAQWKLGYYTITYECANDVDITNMPLTYTIMDEDFPLNSQLKEHYTFSWKIDSKVVTSFDTSMAKDVVVKGIWTPIEYKITYDLAGGTGSNRTTHGIETPEFSLNQPTKNGYTFVGWTGSNGIVPEMDVVISAGNTENLSYTANWSINTYSITYVLFDGNNHAKNPNLYSTGDTIELKDASKEGYRFEGWYTESEFENKVTTLYEQYMNLVLYAKFAPLTYSATFEDVEYIKYSLHLHYWENSDYNTTKFYKSGDSIDLYSIELPEREEYFFGGWFWDSNFTVPVDSNECLYHDVTLYAKWYEKENLVGYSKCNETGLNNQDLSWDVEPFEVKSMDLSFSASGWRGYERTRADTYSVYFYVPYTHAGDVSISYSVSAGGTLQNKVGKAQVYLYDVTQKTYIFNVSKSGSRSSASKTLTVTLEAGHYYRLYCYVYGYSYRYYSSSDGYASASGYASISIGTINKYTQQTIFSNIVPQTFDGETFFPPVSRDGYDFVGWYDDSGNPMTDIWTYTSDQTFYARWEIHEYSIQYVLNGGTNNAHNPLTFVSNDNIVLNAPERIGYTFDGWYFDSAFQNKTEHINGELCDDITLYAKWIPNTYVATLDYCGGENSPTIQFFSNGILIKSIDLYKDSILGYFIPKSYDESMVFAGWYLDSDLSQAFDFSGTINKDMNLYAKWISITNTYSELGKTIPITIVGKTEQLIEIVPLISQTIEIKSISDLDLFGAIYDENMNMLASYDDISDENLNFTIQIALQAGNKYYISYRANQNSVSGEAILQIVGIQCPSVQVVGDYTSIIESIEVTYDSSFALPTPKKEGYQFVGWFDENGKMIDDSEWKYISNMTIYAYWTNQE